MRKLTANVVLTLVLTFPLSTLLANHVDLYINTYKDIAIREMQRSGIPASITLSQGIIESSWGGGELASNSNNHFGIKCKDYWTGPSYYIEDDDYENGRLIKSCFRAYANPEESYIDHTNFLMNNERYHALFTYAQTDYVNWAKGLKACGYATDAEYAEKLIRMIEKYNLHRFDTQEMPIAIASAPHYKLPEQYTSTNTAIDANAQPSLPLRSTTGGSV